MLIPLGGIPYAVNAAASRGVHNIKNKLDAQAQAPQVDPQEQAANDFVANLDSLAEYLKSDQKGYISSKVQDKMREVVADKFGDSLNTNGTATTDANASSKSDSKSGSNSGNGSSSSNESSYDWEYEYKPGDTFGQVLLNLGASDGSNLWGPAGDVAYYTQQLREQDMLDANGNVKLGKKFRLKKRPSNV